VRGIIDEDIHSAEDSFHLVKHVGNDGRVGQIDFQGFHRAATCTNGRENGIGSVGILCTAFPGNRGRTDFGWETKIGGKHDSAFCCEGMRSRCADTIGIIDASYQDNLVLQSGINHRVCCLLPRLQTQCDSNERANAQLVSEWIWQLSHGVRQLPAHLLYMLVSQALALQEAVRPCHGYNMCPTPPLHQDNDTSGAMSRNGLQHTSRRLVSRCCEAALGEEIREKIACLKWSLWHRQVDKALSKIDDLASSITPFNETYARCHHLAKALSALRTSIVNNRHLRPHDGQRYHHGEAIATGFVASTVHEVVRKRFCKKQQMQWSTPGAHLLLQTRGKTLDGEGSAIFKSWYPDLDIAIEERPAAV
jgi:hypothetical protein